MYSRLQLQLEVADNPEYCPVRGNVPMEIETTSAVFGYQDLPVTVPDSGEAPIEVACYRTDAEPMLVLLQNLGDEDIRLTTHNGTGTEVHICPAGQAIIAWHVAYNEPQVTLVVTNGGLTSCEARIVMV